MLVTLFATTMFVSALLLFVVQPMIAKLLLPELGGSAAVWTTCMLFFQGVLLCGYGYAHAGARWLSPRRQVMVHVVVVLVAIVSLPIALPALDLDPSTSPSLWLLAALSLAVGLPFFAVSTTAPLLQHWFAHTDHPDASDPYFLYAASNIGSMVALLGYPLVVEPSLGVSAQTTTWSWLYVAFVALLVVCATRVFNVRGSRALNVRSRPEDDSEQRLPRRPVWRERVRWVLLSAVPSSLMLGLTQYVTTDIAPVPLLWVLPLALYLLTFILVFAKRPIWLPNIARLVIPISCAMVFLLDVAMWQEVALHLGNFFLMTLFFHGLLAQERPEVGRLTEFFLLLSVGGVLGGLFNALISPVLFDRDVEYRLVMAAAVACIYPAQLRFDVAKKVRHAFPIFAAVVALAYLRREHFLRVDDESTYLPAIGVVLALLAIGYLRPRFENVAFAVVLAIGAHSAMSTGGVLTYQRSFFAAYKVFETQGLRKFSHGTTAHGSQSLDPERALVPVSYHHPRGPVGQVLDAIPHRDVLIVGLGAGAMAAYATDDMRFDIYEIDPLVEDIAREYFTYLDACADRCEVVIGDGRRLLENASKTWDVIFLDAYNSDAVPAHLLTREALQLYARKLSPGGVIVFHVSNRYLNIEGIVATVAADAGFAAITQVHDPPEEERRAHQIDRSMYTVVAPERANLTPLWESGNWREARASGVLWTDDFSNLIDVIMW